MVAGRLVVVMDEQGQLSLEGPEDFGLLFTLIAAAHEIAVRKLIPPAKPSPILPAPGFILHK